MKPQVFCGVDLGGTKLSAGLFTREGKSLAERKVTDHVGLETGPMMDRVADLVSALPAMAGYSWNDVAVVSVGMAGHIDSGRGLVITSSNHGPSFVNFDLGSVLSSRLGKRVIVDNDANAQAWGEYLLGAGVGKRSMVFITVSTGVGAGIVVEGQLFRGHNGIAGEIGHTIIDRESPVECTCGNRGCLMALSGTLGLSGRYRLALEQGMGSQKSFSAEAVENFDGMMLEEGVTRGDPVSVHLFQESADTIGTAIYNVYQVINPQAVVLGGGLMKLGSVFLERIKSRFEQLVRKMAPEPLEILPAGLGTRAGLVGAAMLPLETENPATSREPRD